MRSILMIALSMILTIQLVGQESNRKQERKDHFENTVHPFITKEHNLVFLGNNNAPLLLKEHNLVLL